ncbi:MAG: hypothetical protein ABJP70_11750 [Erythrobacter sp.]
MRSYRFGVSACMTVCMAILGASALNAETLTVEGIYGSRVSMSGDIEVIAMENLGGNVGPDVALDLSEALGSVYIVGKPYFRIVPASLVGATQVVVIDRSEGGAEQLRVDNPNAPDAVLRGSVRLTSQDRRVKDRVDKKCIAKDDRGKCIEREEVRTRCDEFVVRLNPRIQLIAVDGTQLYSKTNQRSETIRYCADENADIDPDAMADKMVGELIAEIRADIAPNERREDIRIMENRKNLQRSDRNAFRAAVKLTDEDPNSACDAFEALEASNPTQVAVLFNIGLCFEGAGELVVAQEYYNRALESDPGRDYPTWGLQRIESRYRGEAQMEAREQG